MESLSIALSNFLSQNKKFLYLDGIPLIEAIQPIRLDMPHFYNIIINGNVYNNIKAQDILIQLNNKASHEGFILPEKGDYKLSDENLALPKSIERKTNTGLILFIDGEVKIYYCEYTEHETLVQCLFDFGIINNPHIFYGESRIPYIHFSYGELTGNVIDFLIEPTLYEDIQFGHNDAIKLYKNLNKYNLHEDCSYNNKLHRYFKLLYAYIISHYIENGMKYANLKFLKECYEYNVADIFLEKPNDNCNYSIRSSPLTSSPGKYSSLIGSSDIQLFFELNKDNIPYFYQKTIEGINGVSEITNGEYFALSSVVNGGVTSNTADTYYEYNKTIKNITRELHQDLGHNIQIEYVISDDNVYIVQMRLFQKKVLYQDVMVFDPLTMGITYNTGCARGILGKDIIFIKDDTDELAKIEIVKNAKGLIYNGKNRLSHLVTMARIMKIPIALNFNEKYIEQLMGQELDLNCMNTYALLETPQKDNS